MGKPSTSPLSPSSREYLEVKMTATEVRMQEIEFRDHAQKFVDLSAAMQLLSIRAAFTQNDRTDEVIVTMCNDKNQMIRFVSTSPAARIFADRTFHPRSVIHPQALAAVAPYHMWTTMLDQMLQAPPSEPRSWQQAERPPFRTEINPYKKGGPNSSGPLNWG